MNARLGYAFTLCALCITSAINAKEKQYACFRLDLSQYLQEKAPKQIAEYTSTCQKTPSATTCVRNSNLLGYKQAKNGEIAAADCISTYADFLKGCHSVASDAVKTHTRMGCDVVSVVRTKDNKVSAVGIVDLERLYGMHGDVKKTIRYVNKKGIII